jgi:4a-hydroxytetrahydrobiopterin dehydratase
MTTTDGITPIAFHEAEGLEDWRVVCDGATVFLRTSSLAESARLVQGLAEIEGIEDHPPAIDVRHDGVTVRLITAADDWFGPTQRDVEMAQRISAVADQLGLQADSAAVQGVLVIPGAPKDADIFPFWRAVLGYDPRPDSPEEDIIDPRDRGPALWFEEMDEPRPDGGGAIHLAVWVPHDMAEARVQAALAAGGRMVRDRAPSWWTLADPAGNEADVATVIGRD